MDRHLQLQDLKVELNTALKNILDYWINHAIDEKNGGFFGRIDNDNTVDIAAPKGSVLNARILWSFAAAYNFNRNEQYLAMAKRAYLYITDHFIDKEFGGVYWSVNFEGKPIDTKKQVYAIAFTIYGLSEYYRATGLEDAKLKAIALFRSLLRYGYDRVLTGYFEAFTREWLPVDDLRLSEKDANEKKTMNTHLHVLEAYANLYKIWPDEQLKIQIELLLQNFVDHFISKDTSHLRLFFDENWVLRSDLVSYGHDIEAAWLLLESAEAIKHSKMGMIFSQNAIKMAKSATEGLDTDGGLWYEFEPGRNYLVREKHWWVQAEAMVGFFSAWQVSRDVKYLAIVFNNWELIKTKILDHQNGEWFWGVNSSGQVMRAEDKVGIWKCPYHNSRACMEIIKRINQADN